MTHRHDSEELTTLEARSPSRSGARPLTEEGRAKKLEVVVKCDVVGSLDAVVAALGSIHEPDVEIRVIQSGVGAVSKSDVLLALTAGRLVIGFNQGVMPKAEQFARDNGVEIRLYKVIYRLIEDVRKIAQSMVAEPEPEEKIIGRAKVIALFKSTRKGIIIGCEIIDGTFPAGKDFRVISAMGPVYTGRIESVQVEGRSVKEGKTGQQIGLKISGWNQAKEGDLVECYETVKPGEKATWRPRGGIVNIA